MSSIDIKHGSEGPKHDPYAYTEITVRLANGIDVIFHGGLAIWCRVERRGFRKKHIYPPRSKYIQLLDIKRVLPQINKIYAEETEAKQLFQLATGMTIVQAERYYHRLHNPRRCKECGSKHMRWINGYPGEHLLQCDSCKEILSSEFHESEII